jgi:hypothetical protein
VVGADGGGKVITGIRVVGGYSVEGVVAGAVPATNGTGFGDRRSGRSSGDATGRSCTGTSARASRM